jgi:inhibitor of cysteine peptidase
MRQYRVSTVHLRMRVALVVGALPPLLACARRAEPPLSDPSAPIEVRPGAEFSLLLESNPSTGYRWELGDLSHSGVVAPLGSQFQPDAGRRGVPGAGGRERWTFRALAPGDVRLPLIYARPGEGKAARDTAWFTVHVR